MPNSLPFPRAQEPSIYMAPKARPTRRGYRCSGLCIPFLMLFLSLLPSGWFKLKSAVVRKEWTYVDNSRTGNKLPVRGLMGVRIGNRSIPRSNIKATLPVSQEFTVSLCSLPHPTLTFVLFSSALLCLLILHMAFKGLTYDHQVGPDHLCPKSPVIQQY